MNKQQNSIMSKGKVYLFNFPLILKYIVETAGHIVYGYDPPLGDYSICLVSNNHNNKVL